MDNLALEVGVTWQGTLLWYKTFREPGRVHIGGADAEIQLPVLASRAKCELLEVGTPARFFLAPGMNAEISTANGVRQLSGHTQRLPYDLRPGEKLRVGLAGGLLALNVRCVPRGTKAEAPALFDGGSSEFTGAMLAAIVTSLLALIMHLMPAPTVLNDEKPEEIRRATIRFVQPVAMIPEVQAPAISESATPAASPEAAATAPTQSAQPRRHSTPPKATATKPRPAAAGRGLLDAFGSRGLTEKMQQTFSRSGDLTRLAENARGTGSPGERFEPTGLSTSGESGTSAATVGLPGPPAGGRFSGGKSLGGLGPKGSVQVALGARTDESFTAGMDREAIRRVIQSHIREVRHCYERELQSAPDLYGKLILQWDIAGGGRVESAAVKLNELKSAAVGECILAHLRQWRFPEPPADMIGRVAYPFVFSSR